MSPSLSGCGGAHRHTPNCTAHTHTHTHTGIKFISFIQSLALAALLSSLLYLYRCVCPAGVAAFTLPVDFTHVIPSQPCLACSAPGMARSSTLAQSPAWWAATTQCVSVVRSTHVAPDRSLNCAGVGVASGAFEGCMFNCHNGPLAFGSVLQIQVSPPDPPPSLSRALDLSFSHGHALVFSPTRSMRAMHRDARMLCRRSERHAAAADRLRRREGRGDRTDDRPCRPPRPEGHGKLRHHFGPFWSISHAFPIPQDSTTHAPGLTVVHARADWVLTGACNPMACPIHTRHSWLDCRLQGSGSTPLPPGGSPDSA